MNQLPVRFMAKVTLTAGYCWQWNAGCTSFGYGKFSVGRRTVLAHRYAYEAMFGPVPTGLQLDHLCRNPGCVNPDHLEPVTSAENVRRGALPGLVAARNSLARQATECQRGHPFDEANTYIHSGKRCCKACKADRCRRYRADRRAGAPIIAPTTSTFRLVRETS